MTSKPFKKDAPILSFEFFPPKNEEGEARFWETLAALQPYNPDFISVTYGAGGSSRENTTRLVCEAQQRTGIPTVAHLTCIGDSWENLSQLLEQYAANGIRHILALRGDRPPAMAEETLAKGAFQNARQFVAEVNRTFPQFNIGVAAYPEIHPEAVDRQQNLTYFQSKVQAGGQFAITQFFFNNEAYFQFVDDCRALAVNIPIIPGIMPVTDFKQIRRFAELCGAQVPAWLSETMGCIQDDPAAMLDTGVAMAIRQCRELLDRGAPGLHFFTLNRSETVLRILDGL